MHELLNNLFTNKQRMYLVGNLIAVNQEFNNLKKMFYNKNCAEI